MRPLALAATILLALSLAGCTGMNDARQGLQDAQAALDEAKQEAAEAKARYDRVSSATVLREEVVTLNLTVVVENGTLRFEPNATRGDVPIPRANLTRLPEVRLETSGVSAECEPLTCELRLPSGFPLTVAWADKPDEKVRVVDGAVLSRDDARVLATTAAGDLTQ